MVKHLAFCGKSNVTCLALHEGICPDIELCEACKEENMKPEVTAVVMKEVRDFLREKAPHIKSFEFDPIFKQTITVFWREDKGPEGYEQKSQTFESFKHLKEFYESKAASSVPTPDEPVRGCDDCGGESTANQVAGTIPEARDFLGDDVSVGSDRGEVRGSKSVLERIRGYWGG